MIAVGKTNIMEQYSRGEFHHIWVQTCGVDYRSKFITLKNKKIKLQVLTFYVV
jgi:GTPase SAR1 family protein